MIFDCISLGHFKMHNYQTEHTKHTDTQQHSTWSIISAKYSPVNIEFVPTCMTGLPSFIPGLCATRDIIASTNLIRHTFYSEPQTGTEFSGSYKSYTAYNIWAAVMQHLTAAWCGLQQHVIDKAIDQWHAWLRACYVGNTSNIGFDNMNSVFTYYVTCYLRVIWCDNRLLGGDFTFDGLPALYAVKIVATFQVSV